MDTKHYTWEELVAMPPGTILRDWMEGEVRMVILRGPASLCAYLGVPMDHWIAGRAWEEIEIDCHWGLTFSDNGDDRYLPSGYWWYGWDYGHSGDYAFYYDQFPLNRLSLFRNRDKKWLVEDVLEDMKRSVASFKELLTTGEEIINKIKE